MKVPSKRKKFSFAIVEDSFGIFAAAAIAFILAISTANIIGRYIFSRPVPGTIEIATVVIVLIIFLSTSLVQRMQLHIGMDVLPQIARRKNPRFYHGLQIFHYFIFFAVMAIIGYYFIPSTMESISMNEKTNGPLFIVIWPFKVAVVIGCFLICIRLLIQIYNYIRHFGNLAEAEGEKEE